MMWDYAWAVVSQWWGIVAVVFFLMNLASIVSPYLQALGENPRTVARTLGVDRATMYRHLAKLAG
jgi:hypothetical protein